MPGTMRTKARLLREVLNKTVCVVRSTKTRSVSIIHTVNGSQVPIMEDKITSGLAAKRKRLIDGLTTGEKYTICIEGNIGSGKTTLLNYFKKFEMAEVYQEPVNKWRDIQGHNGLALMYKDPTRWSLTFQTYVQLTMLDLHTRPQTKPVKMMERSIHSAKYCFVENLHDSGKMPDIEYIILTEWFDWILKTQDVGVDLIVYLKTDPETVFKRIQHRHREEEKLIPLEYLQTLHNLHEDWLIHKKFPCSSEVLVLDGNPGVEDMLKIYEENKSKILPDCSS